MSKRNFDSSTLTKLQSHRAIAFFQTRQQLLTDSTGPNNHFPVLNAQTGNFNATHIRHVNEGSFTTWTQGSSLLIPSIPPISELPYPLIIPPLPPVSPDFTVVYAFESILKFSAASNFAPTVMSRIQYVWFMAAVGAWNWVQSSPALTGTKDQWDFTIQYPLNYDDSTTWMVIAINHIMPLFITTNLSTYYDTSYLLNRTKDCHGWDDQQLAAEIQRIETFGNWTAWTTALTAWLTYRNADGYLTARIPGPLPASPNAQYRNGNTRLNPSATQDFTDATAYPSPSSWTPLVINGANKLYATPLWGTVLSTCLTVQNEQDLSGLAAPFFPNSAQRESELADIVQTTATLTDSQKIIAEWWAGGPSTVTPPGIMMWYWKNYMTTYNIATTYNMTTFMLSGLQATISLFEAGRVVWAQKLGYSQSRPIQDIRRLYRGQVITGYNGQGISGESWMPYQETTFVTPPFPDFTSGHSAYSKIFANVMGQWFGDAINTTRPLTMTDLSLVTPDLTGTQTQTFGTVVFPQGSSRIEPGTVPTAPITLTFSSWSDLANSAGISRQYGGIHATSAHQGSLAIVDGLYPMIRSAWGL